MHIETLNQQHSDLLLSFETENRDWFETLIAPRDDSFYSPSGIAEHISHCINLHNNGQMHPSVLIESEKIIGRVNLREINLIDRTCTIGYRIAKNFSGKGLATFCVAESLHIAFKQYNLAKVFAYVLENNSASAAILAKNNFIEIGKSDETYTINGTEYPCSVYLKQRDN